MDRTQVLVVGAGPAGLCAAIEAARADLSVVVVDDNPSAGGQIYRQLPDGFDYSQDVDPGREFRRGKELLAEASDLDIDFRFATTAWGQFEPGVLEVLSGDRVGRIRAERTVLATGAYDRPVPVPGWTLPGVFTVGGAQALLKSQRVLVGQRVLLAGAGPLLLVVASQLHGAGAEVVAVSEPVSFLRLLRRLPAILGEPDLARDGIRYRWSLTRGRVPWHSKTRLVRVEGSDAVERAVIADVDRDWAPIEGTERAFEVDVVCTGYGLLPSLELPRICGCELTYAPEMRAWVPLRDDEMKSSVPDVYIVGDCAGIAGAIAAAIEGRIAGIAIARDLGNLDGAAVEPQLSRLRSRLQRLDRFRRAMDDVYGPRPGLYSLGEQETTVCRCEEVKLADLQSAYADGARSFNLVKGWTRTGMGPCQARMCSPFVLEWLARSLGKPLAQVDPVGVRPPAKPVVSLGSLAADLETVGR